MAGQDARECALSRMADVDCRHSRLVPDTLLSVVVLDFSGKLQKWLAGRGRRAAVHTTPATPYRRQ